MPIRNPETLLGKGGELTALSLLLSLAQSPSGVLNTRLRLQTPRLNGHSDASYAPQHSILHSEHEQLLTCSIPRDALTQ